MARRRLRICANNSPRSAENNGVRFCFRHPVAGMSRVATAIAGGRAYAFLCGATLFVLLGLTVLDVGGREILNRPLPGGYEISELALLALFFLALPATTLHDEHITVTLVDRWLTDRGRRTLSALGDFLTLAVLGALTPFLWRQADGMTQYGDVTLYLQIRTAPFVYFAAILTGSTALLAAARLVSRTFAATALPGPGR